MRLIYRRAPGRGGALSTALAKTGRVLADPAEMAAELRGHWADAFRAKGIDHSLLEQRLSEDVASAGAAGAIEGAPAFPKLRKRR
eukprot:2420348-Pyramimonas_sp.AAC.1